MMRPDIYRCKPSIKRRWITKNRKRQTLIKSLAVALCLCMAVITAFYMFAAGAKSASAESAGVSASIITAPVSDDDIQASPTVVSEPVSGPRPWHNTEPALIPEKKPQVTVALGDTVMSLQTELLPGIKTAPKVIENAEVKQPETKIAKPVKKPVVEFVKVQPKKVEQVQAASTIPSFENTSGEADTGKVEVASAKADEAPVWRTLLSVVVKLALVVALAYVSILGLKWFMSQKERPTSKGSGLKVVDSVSLGANRSLHVVDCAGKRLILASTPNQVNLISETEAVAAAEQSTGQKFDAYLNSYVASQSEVDNAAVKVGQALRNGAAFLQKKAADYRAHKASGESNRNA